MKEKIIGLLFSTTLLGCNLATPVTNPAGTWFDADVNTTAICGAPAGSAKFTIEIQKPSSSGSTTATLTVDVTGKPSQVVPFTGSYSGTSINMTNSTLGVKPVLVGDFNFSSNRFTGYMRQDCVVGGTEQGLYNFIADKQ
jgi:hypothetical protein